MNLTIRFDCTVHEDVPTLSSDTVATVCGLSLPKPKPARALRLLSDSDTGRGAVGCLECLTWGGWR